MIGVFTFGIDIFTYALQLTTYTAGFTTRSIVGWHPRVLKQTPQFPHDNPTRRQSLP